MAVGQTQYRPKSCTICVPGRQEGRQSGVRSGRKRLPDHRRGNSKAALRLQALLSALCWGSGKGPKGGRGRMGGRLKSRTGPGTALSCQVFQLPWGLCGAFDRQRRRWRGVGRGSGLGRMCCDIPILGLIARWYLLLLSCVFGFAFLILT